MELWLLLLACAAATYVWRALGVAVATRIDPKSEAFAWVSCVAYAIIAGLVSRMLLMPTGELAATTAAERAVGSAAALVAYFILTRRNLFVGILAGALALAVARAAGGA